MANTSSEAAGSHRPGVLLGVVTLIVGTLVYVLDRPVGSVEFFAPWSLAGRVPDIFGPLGQSLPTFAHVFGFSLLSGALYACGRHAARCICLGWCVIDLGFELAQHASLAPYVAALLPKALDDLPILRYANGYFVGGTFDPADAASIVLGATAAYAVLTCLAKKE